MKITKGGKEIELGLAVERSLDRSYDGGELERLRDRLDYQAKAIAALVVLLHGVGTLPVEGLSDFLEWDYKVEED